MKVFVDNIEGRRSGIELLILKHKEETIHWPVPGYKTAGIPHRERLFDDFNSLVEKLPENHQEAIWALYKEARDVLNQVTDLPALFAELSKIVAQIYDIVDYETVRRYVYVSGNIQLPHNLKTAYGDGDIVERTYLKDDYIGMVILALGMRFMVPIWGEYLSIVSERTGSEFKEKSVYDLIKRSNLFRWQPLERLNEYVAATVGDLDSSLSTLLGGLSSVEIPQYMLALGVVRKLAIGPVSAYTDDDNLIRSFYNFVDGNSKRLDVRFAGNIAPKKPLHEGADDDNSSVWDMYKINQGVSDGDKVLIEVFTEDVDNMISRIHPDMEDMEKLELCMSTMTKLHNIDVEYHHVVFTQWVLAKVLPPKGVQSLNKKSLLRCMAVVQAVLWDWGFHELALLMGAQRIKNDRSDMFIGLDGRNRVHRDLVEKLNETHPYYRRRSRKVDPNKRENIVVKAIDTVCDSFVRDEWRINAPEALMNAHGHTQITRVMTISGDIKNQMAKLVLHINQ